MIAFEIQDPNLRSTEAAIIPLARPLPIGSSDLPGGRSSSWNLKIWDFKFEIWDLKSKTASGGQPCWRLPIWSCTARSLPGRACHHPRRCALTRFKSEISNLKLACRPHHFTHHPDLRVWDFRSEISKPQAGRLVCFLLHLSSFERITPQISNLRSEN